MIKQLARTTIDRPVIKSQRLFAEARSHTPGGVNSFSRALDPPLVFKRAKGAYLFDADGNRYIDYHAAFGAIILGHCHSRVDRAVSRTMSKIDLVGIGTTELEIRLAKKLSEHVPSAEMVHLCNTGTEATYNAVRLARAVTGRKKLLKFQGCFHGTHDYLCMNVITPSNRMGTLDPGSAGMLSEAIQQTLVAEFNNIVEVENLVRQHCNDLAAIILEPIAHNIGCVVAKQEFLLTLRDLTLRYGIILIFDEVITGFRHGLGGYQKVCGVTPDLSTLAKGIANGFPCAALVGKKELMNRFNTAGGDVIFAGTYNGSPMSTAAALATIRELEDGKAHQRMFQLGGEIRQRIKEVIAETGTKAMVAGFGSTFVIYFMEPPADSYRDLLRNNSAMDVEFRRRLIDLGILVSPYALKRNHITPCLTVQDVNDTMKAIRTSLIGLSQ